MSCITQEALDKVKQAALALTPEQRAALTWEDALEFVAADTLELAYFNARHQDKGLTPWQTIANLRAIAE